jgi:hypothetical protein
MVEWMNSHAGLITLGFVALFVVILLFQREPGGPV